MDVERYMTAVVFGFEEVETMRVDDTIVDEEVVKNISRDIGYTLGGSGPVTFMPPPFSGC